LRSSTRAAGRGRPLITRKWSSGYQIIEQRAYAYAALTEDCERAVDEAGGAEVKLRDAPGLTQRDLPRTSRPRA